MRDTTSLCVCIHNTMVQILSVCTLVLCLNTLESHGTLIEHIHDIMVTFNLSRMEMDHAVIQVHTAIYTYSWLMFV